MSISLDGLVGAGVVVYCTVEINEPRVPVGEGVMKDGVKAGTFVVFGWGGGRWEDAVELVGIGDETWGKLGLPCGEGGFDRTGCIVKFGTKNGDFRGRGISAYGELDVSLEC